MTKEVFSRVLDYNTGLTGASVLSALTIKYGAFQGFICQDYTVVQVITDAQGNDVTAQMGLRGVTLSPGVYISMAKGDSIYSIILSSGSIVLYDLGANMSSVPGVSDLIAAFSTRASVDGAILESTSCINGPLMPYFKKASFYLTPSAYKEGKLYAQKPITGNGDLTWTRGSDAFRTNSGGLVQRVPWNLVQRSEEFSNAIWSKVNSSITANIINAPNGTLTADKLVEDSTNNAHYNNQQFTNSNSLLTYSLYAKAGERTFLRINAFATLPNNFSYSPTAVFNLSNGTVGTTSACNASIQNVGDGWFRCIMQCTSVFASTSATVNFYNYVSLTDSVFSYQGDGTSGIYIWGAQLVEGTTAQTYLPTTDRLNFPRLSYMYGSCPSALLEPQRTNLALYSEQFNDSYWAVAAITSITANTTTAPNGTTTADTAVVSAIYQNASRGVVAGVTNGVVYTLSVYVKKSASGGASNVRLSVNNTATWTGASTQKVALTNDWQRVTLTWTSNGTQAYFIIGSVDNTGASDSTCYGNIDIWGAQFEAGAYPTTYIQTTSATATRVADSFSRNNIYTNGLISASGGTWFVEFKNNLSLIGDGGGDWISLTDSGGTSGNGLRFYNPPSLSRMIIYKIISSAGTPLFTTTTDSVKVAIKWNGSTADVFVNGVKEVSATVFAFTAMQILSTGITAVPKYIQQMALFPAPLTDTECAAMTTI